MSGGFFDYKQYQLGYIADSIEQVIINYREDKDDSYGEKIRNRYTEAEIEKFEEAVYLIEKAQIYAHRIDWLLSGDDGTDSFFRRLEHDLLELENRYATKINKSQREKDQKQE